MTEIFVDNQSVFDLDDPALDGRFGWAYRMANRVHVPTRSDVVRREILLRVGDCYDELRARDSERLLRGLGFIADADVFGVRQTDGSVHLVVSTRDDWSTRVEPRLGSRDGVRLTGLRIREDNLLGTGQHVSLFLQRDETREVYGFRYHTPQLLASRWNAELEVGRTPAGHLVSQATTYPFIGEVGRWGIRQAIHHEDRQFEYLGRHGDRLFRLLVPERRRSLELGFAHRWSGGGVNRTLAGLALAGEWIGYPDPPFVDPRDDAAPPTTVLPPLALDSAGSLRLLLLAGRRNVSWVRRRGLDTVRGTEDVRLGVEVETGLGPGLLAFADRGDLTANLAVFAAGEPSPGWFVGTQARVEGRRDPGGPAVRSDWVDVLGEVSGWVYARPGPDSPHLWVAALNAVGGWNETIPFQLTLGGDSGLRGYGRHLYAGGRRVVGSIEQRSHVRGRYAALFDLGLVGFADAGRIWAGNAPFGVDSPVRVNVGAGVRAAFPPGSRQTLRVDLAVPVNRGPTAGAPVLTLGVGQAIGYGRVRRDPQLQRSVRMGASSPFHLLPPRP